MPLRVVPTLLAGLLACGTATAGPLILNSAANQAPDRPAPMQQVAVQGPNLGGGFLEMLFGGPGRAAPSSYSPSPAVPDYGQFEGTDPRNMDPRFLPQEVEYEGKEAPGTIIINTPERFLYLVEGSGRAMRYGIGVGRPGFT